VVHSERRPSPPHAADIQPPPKPPVGFFDLEVPVKLSNSAWGTANLADTIRDVLYAITPSALVVDCPLRMRAGSTEQVRLTSRQNLNDLLRLQLQARGIPAEYLMGITTSVVADLTSPADDAFAIQPEKSAAGPSPDKWVWRVSARKSGSHELDVIVTLSARIPSRGEVEARAWVFSRSVGVDAGPVDPFVDFLTRFGTKIAGSLAALLGAWLVWTLWRTRRAAFSHR
jgi:hypothetical protein